MMDLIYLMITDWNSEDVNTMSSEPNRF